jgi:hypothetical protein
MNLWTRVGVDEPGSRVEGGEPILCDYASIYLLMNTAGWNYVRFFSFMGPFFSEANSAILHEAQDTNMIS